MHPSNSKTFSKVIPFLRMETIETFGNQSTWVVSVLKQTMGQMRDKERRKCGRLPENRLFFSKILKQFSTFVTKFLPFFKIGKHFIFSKPNSPKPIFLFFFFFFSPFKATPRLAGMDIK